MVDFPLGCGRGLGMEQVYFRGIASSVFPKEFERTYLNVRDCYQCGTPRYSWYILCEACAVKAGLIW